MTLVEQRLDKFSALQERTLHVDRQQSYSSDIYKVIIKSSDEMRSVESYAFYYAAGDEEESIALIYEEHDGCMVPMLLKESPRDLSGRRNYLSALINASTFIEHLFDRSNITYVEFHGAVHNIME